MLALQKKQGGKRINNPQIFELIDNIFPFEACLYYQILPLSVEGSRVRLAVVDPKDYSALDYARRLLSYLHCSLVTEEISCEIQRSILSSYLSYICHQEQKKSSTIRVTLAEKNQQKINNSHHATVQNNKQFSKAKNVTDKDFLRKDYKNLEQIKFQSSSKKSLCNILELSLPNSAKAISLETIITLNSQNLLKELLVKVLESGIGRIYFEQQQSKGKIFWIQDGVLKSAVENLEPKKIEAIINELKIFTKMPLAPIKKPRQVEIERIYKNNHILLCLRVIPGDYGETATLQVLRGKALRFYQQQKLSLLSQDTLKLGRKIQFKINQVSSYQDLALDQIDSLLTLQKLLDNVERQIDCIISKQDNQFA